VKPLRIGMVAACPYPTTQGTQVYIRDMVRALVARGHVVHLVVYGHGEDLDPCGAILHRTPSLPGYRRLRSGPDLHKPLLDALLVAPLLRLARAGQLDVIHAHNYEAPLAAYLVRALCGVPVLYNAHNLMADELHRYFSGAVGRSIARRFAGLLDREIPRRADRCLVLSEQAASALVELGVREQDIDFLPPAVHWDQFEGSRANPGREAQRPTVVYAGNPDRYQDLDVLLRAMQRVTRKLPGARLLLVSGAEPREALQMASELGIEPPSIEVLVTNCWSEVRKAMAQAQVAALPRGLCRGFPVKLLNYQALGLPVVACAGSAHGLEDTNSALLVDDGDHGAFAEALLTLLADPERRDRMGRAGRSSVRTKHTWDQRIGQLEMVYQRTIALESTARLR
jgi:glycosyltransferase involved in cell wall biosynthesis